jgi:hypothetical protein
MQVKRLLAAQISVRPSSRHSSPSACGPNCDRHERRLCGRESVDGLNAGVVTPSLKGRQRGVRDAREAGADPGNDVVVSTP